MRRRTFLIGAATTAAGLVVPSFSQVPAGNRLVVRSPRPLDLEPPVQLFDSWITPNHLFYVRSHLYTPAVDAARWRLRIDGEVERPFEITLRDLHRLGVTEHVAVMECAGNGRAFFSPRVPGVQWEKGAVGNARWTGVRLADLLHRAGVKASGKHLTMDGADQPIGQVPDFVRSIPIEKALDPNTLLAHTMNGEPLPKEHGFPLRAIVPGWEGAAWVKWLTHLTVTTAEPDGHFMRNAYRFPTYVPAPDEAVDPAKMAVITNLAVKSMITAPVEGALLSAGKAAMQGFAWSGGSEVERVDVSTDSGHTWQAAQLGQDRAPFAWRMWRHEWNAVPGSHSLLSRATDTRGRVQPAEAVWNPSGYLWNVIDHVRVEVVAGERGEAILKEHCLSCHDMTLIENQHLARPKWIREVEKMMRWGSPVPSSDKEALVDYLAKKYPDKK